MIILVPIAMGAVLGFAAHRAGLCTVKAVAEILSTGRAHVLWSFIKSALWIMGLAALAAALSLEAPVRHWPLMASSLAGGLIFGIGAAMNGGCAFSTLARAMDGDLNIAVAVAAWPLGIVLARSAWDAQPEWQAIGTFDLHGPLLLGLAVLLSVELWRVLARILRTGTLARSLLAPVYTLSAAAAIIGIANAIILLTMGPWSFTATLLCLPGGEGLAGCGRPGLSVAIFAAAAAGMLASSVQRGSFRVRHLRARSALRHGMAGLMMGMAMVMIPGGNDGLILFAIPSLSPHALPAYAAMILGIMAALATMHALGQRVPPISCVGDICRSEPAPSRSPPGWRGTEAAP